MTDKTATTGQPILNAIANRWSPRSFADKPVSPAQLQQLLEAARWAASAFNAQPWRFIVATKEDMAEYEKVLACLGEFNQAWAKSAPVLMIVSAANKFSHNDKPNRHGGYDTGQAVASLSIQATELGLYLHQMAGFSPDAARETFTIPDDFEPMVAIALGYLGEPDQLSEQMKERELMARERMPLSELVFSGTWGEASGLVESA